MKKIILATAFVFGGTVGALAQSQGDTSLFPDLDLPLVQEEGDISVQEKNTSETIAVELVEENNEEQEMVEVELQNEQSADNGVVQSGQDKESTEKRQPEQPLADEESAESLQENDEEEESEEEKEKYIYMALNDVRTYMAAVREVSYCSGAFVMFNDTKRLVQQISGKIGIGGQQKDYKFENIEPGKSVGLSIQIVGTACESMLSMPDVQIDVCKVEGMSEKKCKSKLIFIPIASGQTAR